MNATQLADGLRRRYEEICAALASAERDEYPGDPDGLRDQIVALFRDTEGHLAELTELRDAIRPLVDRYKALSRPPATPSTEPAAPTLRMDHLGASTYVERGWSAIAMGDYPNAVTELERALQLAPAQAHAEALLAWALVRLGRTTEALPLLEGILAREPEHGLALANLGYACYREGRFAEAVEHLTRVLRNPQNRTAALYANLYLGVAHAEREMYRDARGFFQRALELGPNLSEAYWEMGRAFYREGNRDFALEVWQRGAAANRYNPWGERCAQAATRLLEGETVSVD